MTDARDQECAEEQLHYAVQDGDVEAVRLLIASGLPLDELDEIGRTPLHYAVVAESVEMATLLLDAGADVNAHDEAHAGNTPLAEVAGRCSFEIAEVLVVNGADPTIPGWMQLSALDRASGRKRPEGRRVLELLQKAANR
ncbi:MAG: ankyrin repeat domain-containing protein [Acidimicrobiia bacterium]